jgi:translation initiation factor IF-2
MKTLTEISGTLVRSAAAAIAEARRSMPREETTFPPAVVVGETPAEGAEPAVAAPAEPAPKLDPDAESEDVKALLDAAVAKATGCSGERLEMIRAAVKAAGRRTSDVRLVRVFGVEEPLRGAHVIGERQYVVDLLPSSMQQVADAHRKERGRGPGGGKGGGGGGDRGSKGSTSGGFSMDSVKDDRKGSRGGGRPGGTPPRK